MNVHLRDVGYFPVLRFAFPADVLALVVEQVDDRHTLRSVSLANRWLRRIALPHLFSHLTVKADYPEFDPVAVDAAQTLLDDKFRFISSRNLTLALRSLDVYGRPSGSELAISSPPLPFITSLMTRLPEFRSLHSCTFHHVVFTDAALSVLSSITWSRLSFHKCHTARSFDLPECLSVLDLSVEGHTKFLFAVRRDGRLRSVHLDAMCISGTVFHRREAFGVLTSVTHLSLDIREARSGCRFDLLEGCHGVTRLAVKDTRITRRRANDWANWFQFRGGDFPNLTDYAGPLEVAFYLAMAKPLAALSLDVTHHDQWVACEFDMGPLLSSCRDTLVELTLNVEQVVALASLRTAFEQIAEHGRSIRELRIRVMPGTGAKTALFTPPTFRRTAMCLGTGPLPTDLEILHVETEFEFREEDRVQAAAALLYLLGEYKHLKSVKLEGSEEANVAVHVNPMDGLIL